MGKERERLIIVRSGVNTRRRERGQRETTEIRHEQVPPTITTELARKAQSDQSAHGRVRARGTRESSRPDDSGVRAKKKAYHT